MPVLNFDSLEQIPEELRGSAKPDTATGKIVLNVVAANKIDEFRDNNIRISKERDELANLLNPLRPVIGDDPAAFLAQLEELNALKQRVENGEIKESKGLDEVVAKRTEEMRKSLTDRIEAQARENGAWKKNYEELDGNYRRSLVTSAIKDVAMLADVGVDPRAMGDLTTKALGVFKVDDEGRIVAMAGDAPLYGPDGVSPMTPKEWLVKLKDEAPYFFKGSTGGGAGGDRTSKVHGRTHAELKAMTASQRLALVNGEKNARL
jgi:hypothetical protein